VNHIDGNDRTEGLGFSSSGASRFQGEVAAFPRSIPELKGRPVLLLVFTGEGASVPGKVNDGRVSESVEGEGKDTE
jgi:hypothetical protein